MRRASKLLVNSAKLQTERDKVGAENQTRILNILEDVQSSLLKLTSHLVMKKKININDYFPINDDAGVARFLDKSDGMFAEKRDEFENLLFCHVTKNVKLKRSFEANFLSIVFTRDFISSHRWPGPRYYFFPLQFLFIYLFSLLHFEKKKLLYAPSTFQSRSSGPRHRGS